MTVGCVMPTFQQRDWIEAAINSVIDQVDELVIVDDASTDGTTKWLQERQYKTVFRMSNQGTASAINAGIDWIGEYHDWLTWVSSDNIMAPDWIETLLKHATPNTGAVYGGFTILTNPSPGAARDNGQQPVTQYAFQEYDPGKLISSLSCYFGPAFIIRSDVWQKHEGKISHDYGNWIKVEEACWDKGLDIIGVNKSLCTYNAHPERVTVTRSHEFDANKWQARAIERRRR